MPRNIKIVSSDTAEIPTRNAVKYKHITLTVWRFDYTHSCQWIIENALNRNGRVGGGSIGWSKYYETENSDRSSRVRREASFAGGKMTMAISKRGDKSEHEFDLIGSIIEDLRNVLGRIEMDIFILKFDVSFFARTDDKGICGLCTS